jgi:hypothetical protein
LLRWNETATGSAIVLNPHSTSHHHANLAAKVVRGARIAGLWVIAAFASVACASVSQGTVEGWAQGRLLVRSDSLVPGDKVVIRHYTQCRATACRGYDTHGVVQSRMAGEPALVTVAVPVYVNAHSYDYLDVGDEVALTKP